MCGKVRAGYRGLVTKTAAYYLRDFGPLLFELALAAKADADADASGDGFNRGRASGLYEAVSLLVQQADAFGIDRDEVGLAGRDPDRELL